MKQNKTKKRKRKKEKKVKYRRERGKMHAYICMSVRLISESVSELPGDSFAMTISS
jgi:hypothetical protein